MVELRGKVVVITGASSGIGMETAKAFAREGCRLALGARREDRLEDVRREVESSGGEALALVADVRSEEQVHALVDAARQRWGQVDILVNNAGYGSLKPFIDTSVFEIRDQMETNFFGAVYGIKAVLEDMMPRRSGHIFNIASVVAKFPTPNYSAYSATKAALDALSTTLRAELSLYGIQVTAVHPSATDTEFWGKAAGSRASRMTRLFMQSPATV
ncbi:MAG: SDR family NAD(P)-dependent oxidoreductase, partial [Chloroflexota bacterium]|nr:SDR family NAD(P)-dependent oxidoreductase [Chloroflexota bacterium]